MADYKFVDVSADLYDMVVDAEFATPLPAWKTKDLLIEVLNILHLGTRLPSLFEGLSAFQVTDKRIEISFRFSRKSDAVAALSETARDELPRMLTHFVIHVFAKLDRVHKLGAVPFPADFRKFIEFAI